MNTLQILIVVLSGLGIVASALYIKFKEDKEYEDSQEEDYRDYPFILVPTKLYLFKKDNGKKKKYFDDELLNDLYDEEDDDVKKDQTKIINTKTLIHVNTIVRLSEWTSSNFEDEKILSNCTMIILNNGDEILAEMNIDLVESMIAHKYGY